MLNTSLKPYPIQKKLQLTLICLKTNTFIRWSHINLCKNVSLSPPDSMRCSTCMLSELCLPLGMPAPELNKLDELIQERIRLTKGSPLFHLGDHVDAVYALRSGSIKTQLEDSTGQVQITGFLLPGEIVGMDGLLNNEHVSHAIALEDSEVCVMQLNDFDPYHCNYQCCRRSYVV